MQNKITPIFTSDWSIGKSILRIKPNKDPLGSDSIIDICKEFSIKDCYLLENNMGGKLQTIPEFQKAGINLQMGFRATMEDGTKMQFWAKDDIGNRLLEKFHTRMHTSENKTLSYEDAKNLYNESHIYIVTDFYDGFLAHNFMNLVSIAPKLNWFGKSNCFFAIQDNNLPFDKILSGITLDFCKNYDYSPTYVKSIYYKNKADFLAWQTYKIATGRKTYKDASLEKPEMDYCGSDNFCIEDWKERGHK